MDQLLYEELRSLTKRTDKESRSRLRDELSVLTDTEKAEFARKMKYDDELEKPASNEFRGVKSQKGKVALVEYTNQSQDFVIRSAFLSMMNYMFDRFRTAKLDEVEQQAVSKFLNLLFDHSSSNHVDSVYDVFVKPIQREREESLLHSSAQVNPAYIPEAKVAEFDRFADAAVCASSKNANIIKCKFYDEVTSELVQCYSQLVAPISIEEMKKLEMQERWFIVVKNKLVPMPSYSQLRNASNFYINKFEEHRFLTSLIFQQRPENELLLHLHGLFDTMEKADEYRVKESQSIHDKVVAMPVGYSALAGDFRANRDGIVMYNPSDPDIELMINGKQNIRRAESNVMKKRSMSKLADRTNPETMRMIREFNKQKELLRSKGEKKVREKLSQAEVTEGFRTIEQAQTILDKKINDALQFLNDDEVVFNTLKVKDGKMSKGEDYVVKLD